MEFYSEVFLWVVFVVTAYVWSNSSAELEDTQELYSSELKITHSIKASDSSGLRKVGVQVVDQEIYHHPMTDLAQLLTDKEYW